MTNIEVTPNSPFARLLVERKKKKQNQLRQLTEEEIERQVIEWTTFYRRNWELYAKEELGINLYDFQSYALHMMGVSEVFFEQCSRGLTKSWLAGLGGTVQCMLYPYSEVVLTATTIGTAKKLVKEKIEKELCNKMSPKLKWLYDNGQITFTYSQQEVVVNFLFNNSWIKVLPEVDSSLGERACMLMFEEARLMKQYFVDSVFMPMSRPRQAFYLTLPEYQDKNGKPLPELVEPCRKIYLTSTKYKYMWFWDRWKKVVEGFFNGGIVRYNFLCGDIFTALAHGIKSEQDLQEYRDTMSELELRMEIYNEPIGEVEGAYYTLEEFKRNSIILDAFIPPTDEEWVFKYLKGELPCFREKKDGEVRIIYVDFAFSDTINKNQSNDNTIIGCLSAYPNEDGTLMLRNLEHMETYEGGKKDESILRIRELFYMYGADIYLQDLRNGGEDRYVDLTKPYYHETWGMQLNGFGIHHDNEILKYFCDLGKCDNLRSRVVDTNAIPVTIPVIGTDERNNNFHISMKKALEKNCIRFLMDEMDVKNELEEDIDFLTLEPEERVRRLIGHVQVNEMVNEAIKLEKSINKGFIKLSESKRTDTKDRIVATEYANYLVELLELDMIKGTQTQGISEALIAGLFL